MKNRKLKILITWEKVVCKPKRFGELGITNLSYKNLTLLAKWWWRYGTDKDALWRRLIMEKYGAGQPHWIPSSSSTARMSSIWRSIVQLPSIEGMQNLVGFHAYRWIVGNGETICFWFDKWIDDIPLASKFPRLFSLAVDKDMRVLDACQNGLWSINFRRVLYSWEKEDLDRILNSLSSVSLVPLRDDKLVTPTQSGFTPFGNWFFPQRSNASYGWRSSTLSLRKSSSLYVESISPPTSIVVCGVAKLRSVVRTSFSPAHSVGEFGDMFLNGGGSLGVLCVLYPLLCKLGKIRASEGVDAIDDLEWWTDPCLSSKRKAPHHHHVGTSWSPPPTGEFKFNVNGSAKGKPGPAGCDGIL
ncbi:Uncharacterized protein TCM_012134 [Theobroma cacao]|uniref:Reverse transcriptase zinc-binding domain-containing protein n=1 Tax=Theobroma cacao TaxID=3641 RepID=A0A061FVA0_THECC|nr:Uncharacterized protein TCM_012134 [Theobroma cacao]